MAQYVLNAKGVVVTHRSLGKLTIAESTSSVEAKKQELLGDIIRSKLGNSIKTPESKSGKVLDSYVDDEEENLNLPIDRPCS